MDVYSSGVNFSTRWIDYYGDLRDIDLCNVNGGGDANVSNPSRACRAIVSLSSGILDGKTEEGTSSNPINLD